MQTTKSYTISKLVVWKAYKLVKANRGAAGVDGQTIEDFERNLKSNLYKIWNRMSSGSYFPPPVRVVEIPKGNKETRKLLIPTVADRIAQGVVKMYLEPKVEPMFHEDSYGYRPNKSAIEAVAKARQRCWKHNWVFEVDIKGYFDNIDHELMMKAVRKHTNCQWVLLYIRRWLKVPAQQSDGTQVQRDKGTPQGGVISPLLANLFLHYAFDKWVSQRYPGNPFERYADDIVVHCRTKTEAENLKKTIIHRLAQCRLELHMEKSRIIYCKDQRRRGRHTQEKFDFLGYTFRPRLVRSRKGVYFVGFNPAVSNRSKKLLRDRIKSLGVLRYTPRTLQDLSEKMNPVLRGWIHYYDKYYKTEIYSALHNVDVVLMQWAKRKYKRFNRSHAKAYRWLGRIARRNPDLFVHWKIMVKPVAGQ